MISYLRKVKSSALKGVALVRVDFNTSDSWRMEAIVPTIQFLKKQATKIVIVSHKGRPQGFDQKYSLQADAKKLSKLINAPVLFVPFSHNFNEVKKKIDDAPKDSIALIENIRFWEGEEKNSVSFSKQLASLGDYFVNDAFAVSHRSAASTVGVTKFLPSYAGLSLEKEIIHLCGLIEKPKHPFVAVIGGAKAADKLPVMKQLENNVDNFLVGGAAANTLLFLKGQDVKKSLRDTDQKDALQLKKLLRYKNIIMPKDYAWDGDAILDIGPQTIEEFTNIIHSARTILWSGPMGLTEKKKFAKGSIAIAKAVLENKKALSITGGGETVEFLRKNKLEKAFSFISTGGSALLDFLAGKKLPAIEALKKRM